MVAPHQCTGLRPPDLLHGCCEPFGQGGIDLDWRLLGHPMPRQDDDFRQVSARLPHRLRQAGHHRLAGIVIGATQEPHWQVQPAAWRTRAVHGGLPFPAGSPLRHRALTVWRTLASKTVRDRSKRHVSRALGKMFGDGKDHSGIPPLENAPRDACEGWP